MIIQALSDLYEAIPDVPRYGYARKPVSFTLLLDDTGNLIEIQDERSTEGNRVIPKYLNVPDVPKNRTSGIQPNLACDNASYVFGCNGKGSDARAVMCLNSFRELHAHLATEVDDPSTRAVRRFLESWDPEQITGLTYREDILAGGNLVFRRLGTHVHLHDVPGVAEWWWQHVQEELGEKRGQCLVTGKRCTIPLLHPGIKGVRDAQATGAGIVNFNLKAFESYGKKQNHNAPVGYEQVLRYTTSLNWLLNIENNRKKQIGDATTVFWTAKPAPIESLFGELLDPPEDAEINQRLGAILDGMREGRISEDLGDVHTPFYVLGLSPNAARLSVRFWLVSTINEVARRIAEHVQDLHIIPQWPSDEQRPFPPLWLLLRQTAVQGKSENVSPILAGSMMQAILSGKPYPLSLLQSVIQRVRADASTDRVNYLRAALIKASLNRRYRANQQEEITVALDVERKDPGYCLGRLFAVLEIVQRDAVGDPNSSITDRYYAGASANPAVSFPRLIRLSQHHLAKLDPGPRIGRERAIQAIADQIDEFPRFLALNEQGLFALGYYHQKKALYTKKTTNTEEN
jgi:CRISPR-associated protein Csd1